jgi:ketosteroid isomerase-like protein
MPSRNLDLVRSIYADFERGNYFAGDWRAPELEFVMADGPEPGRWSGVAAAAQRWREFLHDWQDTHPQAQEYRELDDESVLVLFRPGGRGKGSGLEVADTGARAATLFQIRGGKATRVVVYLDPEHAFAELGLPPEGGELSPRCPTATSPVRAPSRWSESRRLGASKSVLAHRQEDVG